MKYKILAYLVATIHLIMIVVNACAIPLLIINEPIWIWMPIISCLVSPLLGGTYCIFNKLENYYRQKAGMRLIKDRTDDIWSLILKSDRM